MLGKLHAKRGESTAANLPPPLSFRAKYSREECVEMQKFSCCT